jgi:hypothetical protein
MATKGGEVYIDITARLDALEKGMAAAKDKAVKEGGKAGFDFGAKFGEQARGVVGTLAGPMMAASLAKAIASGLRSEKDIPTAILDAVKTIPFVGAFADLGSAIYDATFGATQKAADDAVAAANAARESILAERGRMAAGEQAQQANAAALTFERRRLEIANQINDVRLAGDERDIAQKRYEIALETLDFDTTLQHVNELSDAEINALNKVNAEKKKAIEAERDAAFRAIEERERKEAAAAAEKARQLAEQQAREEKSRADRERAATDDLQSARLRLAAQRALAAGDADAARLAERELQRNELRLQREKAMRDALTQAERDAVAQRYDIEEQTLALREKQADAESMAASRTGSAQTALGTFVFDAYPPADQKAIQTRIAVATEKFAGQMVAMGIQ